MRVGEMRVSEMRVGEMRVGEMSLNQHLIHLWVLNLIGCPLLTNLVCCVQSFLFLGGLLTDGVPHCVHLLQLLLGE